MGIGYSRKSGVFNMKFRLQALIGDNCLFILNKGRVPSISSCDAFPLGRGLTITGWIRNTAFFNVIPLGERLFRILNILKFTTSVTILRYSSLGGEKVFTGNLF